MGNYIPVLVAAGVSIVRVHDVREMIDVVTVSNRIATGK